MILGTRVQATLWEVHYRHAHPEREGAPEPRARSRLSSHPVVAQLQVSLVAASHDPEARFGHGRCFVLTADPTGTALLEGGTS